MNEFWFENIALKYLGLVEFALSVGLAMMMIVNSIIVRAGQKRRESMQSVT